MRGNGRAVRAHVSPGEASDRTARASPPSDRKSARPGGGCSDTPRDAGRGSAAGADVAACGDSASPGRSSPSRVPLAIIVVAVAANWNRHSQDGPGRHRRRPTRCFLLAAFVVYYLGFPLRGGAGPRCCGAPATGSRPGTARRSSSSRGWSTASYPAKLGDLYRAYLLKLNSPVSATRTLGTVFIERILDLIAIAVLGLAAGYIRFRGSLGRPAARRSRSSSPWASPRRRHGHRP